MNGNILKKIKIIITTALLFTQFGEYSVFTAQKIEFSIKDFFSKCDQIRTNLWVLSYLLKKSLMENFIFYADFVTKFVLNALTGSLKKKN